MFRIELTKSNAQAEAEYLLQNFERDPEYYQKNPSKLSSWETIAWIVSLLQSSKYEHLKSKVEFFRAEPNLPKKEVVFNIDSMKRCIEEDIEIRPQ